MQLLQLLLQSAEEDLANANQTDQSAETQLEDEAEEQGAEVNDKEDECIEIDDTLALQ